MLIKTAICINESSFIKISFDKLVISVKMFYYILFKGASMNKLPLD